MCIWLLVQILVLQEELDVSDKQQRQLEDNVDMKTAALLRLQKLAIELESNQTGLSSNPTALAEVRT